MSAAPTGHAVIVLNWYGKHDTLECVRSLLAGSPEVALIVVDNGSFDGALEAVRDLSSQVRTLQLSENQGFAGGMNRGIEFALAAGFEVITVLNNDTVIPPGSMAGLREMAGPGQAVSPMIMYLDDPGRAWFAGGAYDAEAAYPYHERSDRLLPCVSGLRASPILTGCCVTARASTWRLVGLFDERFFLNFEDSEWSLRAVARGVELAVVCDVRILHAVSASFRRSAADLGSFYFLRNGLLFARLAGARPIAGWRFIRRFGFRGLRRASVRTRWRALTVLVWAMKSHARRQYGVAPLRLRRSVDRWGRADAARTATAGRGAASME